MVEPQEPSSGQKILCLQKTTSAMIAEEAKSMPSEIIGRAESKVSGFRALRSEIEDAMVIVHNKLGEIREKI